MLYEDKTLKIKHNSGVQILLYLTLVSIVILHRPLRIKMYDTRQIISATAELLDLSLIYKYSTI